MPTTSAVPLLFTFLSVLSCMGMRDLRCLAGTGQRAQARVAMGRRCGSDGSLRYGSLVSLEAVNELVATLKLPGQEARPCAIAKSEWRGGESLPGEVTLAELQVLITKKIAADVHLRQKIAVGCGMRDTVSPLKLLPLRLVDLIFAFLKPATTPPLPPSTDWSTAVEGMGPRQPRGMPQTTADGVSFQDMASEMVDKLPEIARLRGAIVELGGTPVSFSKAYLPRDQAQAWNLHALKRHRNALEKQLQEVHTAHYHPVQLLHAASYIGYPDNEEYMTSWYQNPHVDFILCAPNSPAPKWSGDCKTYEDGASVSFCQPVGDLTVSPGTKEMIEDALRRLFPRLAEYVDVTNHKIGSCCIRLVGWNVICSASCG